MVKLRKVSKVKTMTHSKRLQAYVETALWLYTGDNDQPMDRDYDISDLAPETLTAILTLPL
jgi:hypothetical protein